jgi:cytochrome c551/c552
VAVTALARTHMMLNSGGIAAVKDANIRVVSREACVVCHAPGALAAVLVVQMT